MTRHRLSPALRKSAFVTLKMTTAERSLLKTAARGKKTTLAGWSRDVLLRAAESQLLAVASALSDDGVRRHRAARAAKEETS